MKRFITMATIGGMLGLGFGRLTGPSGPTV
jgi:hypothetical protein